MEQDNYIGFDYLSITVKKDQEMLYEDGYLNFGWQLVKTIPGNHQGTKTDMRFKRNRKIRNKAELTRLQREFDATIAGIDMLERSKITRAVNTAITIGMVGTAFMAGSVFAITADAPNVVLSTILAIPAFAGWISPYFCYRYMVQQRSRQIVPFIDEQKDLLYEICEKGNHLLG